MPPHGLLWRGHDFCRWFLQSLPPFIPVLKSGRIRGDLRALTTDIEKPAGELDPELSYRGQVQVLNCMYSYGKLSRFLHE